MCPFNPDVATIGAEIADFVGYHAEILGRSEI